MHRPIKKMTPLKFEESTCSATDNPAGVRLDTVAIVPKWVQINVMRRSLGPSHSVFAVLHCMSSAFPKAYVRKHDGATLDRLAHVDYITEHERHTRSFVKFCKTGIE